jgi:hypothetical protein
MIKKALSDAETSLFNVMNSRNSTLSPPAGRASGSASSLSVGIYGALERLAHHAALEARLRREETPRLGEAVAAVRRVSTDIARQAGLDVSEDERGDVWALREGVAIAFLGHRDGSGSSYPLT